MTFTYLAFITALELFIEGRGPAIVALSAVLGALILLRRQVEVCLRALARFGAGFRRWLTAPGVLLKKMAAQDAMLLDIKRQLFPNGGTSLSDKLNETLRMAKRAERRSYIIAESSTVATFECDDKGNCVWVNSALAGLFGMERSEMLGSGWLKAIETGDRARVWANFQEAISSKIPYSVEYVAVNQKTEERIPCFAEAEITRDMDGTVIFIHGVVIPARKYIDTAAK